MAKGNCQFKGTGAQYFGTVFIHLFLISVITFGIYSAWAWVRLLKLKASHTTINGKSVSFNGTGGQLFVLILVQGLLTIITFGIYGPWALCKFFDWKTQNTMVGGRPSQFTGTGGGLFLFFLIHLVVLPILTFGLYYFYGIYRLYAWKEERTNYGGEKTSFGAGFVHFLKVALLSWILNIVTLNLFTPWAICMLYRWQIEGLMVGDADDIKHFPPAKTSLLTVVIIVIIGLLPWVLLGLFIKSQFTKHAREVSRLTTMQPGGIKEGETYKVPLPKPKPPMPVVQTPPQKAPLISESHPEDQARKSEGYDEKMNQINEMVKKDPLNAQLFYNRARVEADVGKISDAERDYTQAINFDKDFGDAFYNRGLVYVTLKKFDQAVRDFTEAIRLNPRAVDAYCNRGNAYYEMGKLDVAVQDYKAALKMVPGDGDLNFNLGVVILSQGERSEADEHFKRAARMGNERAQEVLKEKGPTVKPTAQEVNAARQAAQQTGWRMDLTRVKIPDSSARGEIHGKVFEVEEAKVDNGILTLRQGKDFFADQEIMAFLFLKKDENPDGKTFDISKASGFGAPHIHMKWKEGGKQIPETKVFTKDYVMLLQFGQRDNAQLPGKIYLCLPDEMKSFVAGTFNAKVK